VRWPSSVEIRIFNLFTGCVSYHSITVTKCLRETKADKVCFGSGFPMFQSIVAWPHHCGPVARQSIMVVKVWHNSSAYVIEMERRRGRRRRGWEQAIPFQGEMTYFLQLGRTSQEPTNELINGSVHYDASALVIQPPLISTITWGPSKSSIQDPLGTFHIQNITQLIELDILMKVNNSCTHTFLHTISGHSEVP
jgi:hypothetical protein